jgi:fibronectin type III domain protein
MEQHMSDLTKQQFFPRTGVTETACISLRLIAIVAGLLLTMMPLLTGCGGGGETGSEPSAAPVGVTASLAWSPVQDPSIIAYFVHYGRQSPGQPGSCAYEHSMHVTSPSATVINLDPNTLYYFTVSAYNGLESACSHEVSTVTDPLSV